MITFVNMIGLLGNSYLQFKIEDEYYIYKFCCETTAQKIKYMVQFSSGKALNQAKKKANSWWKQSSEWNGWTPEGSVQMDIGIDVWKHKPVKWEQLELCKLST